MEFNEDNDGLNLTVEEVKEHVKSLLQRTLETDWVVIAESHPTGYYLSQEGCDQIRHGLRQVTFDLSHVSGDLADDVASEDE